MWWLFPRFHYSLPFQHQVEPVPNDSHPDEPEPCVSAQVKPDGKQKEEGGVQISHGGRQPEKLLILAVSALQMNCQFNPPAVKKVHRAQRQRAIAKDWSFAFFFVGKGSGKCVPGCPVSVWFPHGLYSRLANLFAFGTVQTVPLTFTPLRLCLVKPINRKWSCLSLDF